MPEQSKKTDEEIAKIAQGEDAEAYSILVTRYQPKLTRYISWLAQDDNLTDDIVQEAFIKGFVNLQSFKTDKKFSSWIYRIAHNEAINQLKRQKKLVDISVFEEIFRSKESIELEYELDETKKILRENLNEISTKYSEPLILFFLEEKSYDEISDILRMPTGTVGTRINRGKKLLKEIYERSS